MDKTVMHGVAVLEPEPSYPFDDVTKDTPCKHLIPVGRAGKKILVATRRFIPGRKFHCQDIPEDYAKVEVRTVIEAYRMHELNFLTTEQIVYLEDAIDKLILWHKNDIELGFKNRMGVSNSPQMALDLEALFDWHIHLSSLVNMFSTQKIDSLISIIPADKAPRPDGFNGFFMKKCWHIIAQDYYGLAAHFQARCVDLEILNSSFITLVPKKSSLETVNDYRPISLMGISLKILTKLLAVRLQGVILKLEKSYKIVLPGLLNIFTNVSSQRGKLSSYNSLSSASYGFYTKMD
uniref:Retrotransposon protein, putative, LINE subclass n=1 Tax=Oryza sativa subsp. japonica TaxID=39947 RepID=Q2QRN9_ORYSJ|nr:retrotransposon protein, putative, LINE subclass [Oryza sativa Japonica Group]